MKIFLFTKVAVWFLIFGLWPSPMMRAFVHFIRRPNGLWVPSRAAIGFISFWAASGWHIMANKNKRRRVDGPSSTTVDVVMNPSLLEVRTAMKRGYPCIFRSSISAWPAAAWDLEHLRETYGEIETTIRIHPRHSKEVIWEADCHYLPITLGEFCEWMLSSSTRSDHPLNSMDPEYFWAYADYKHFESLFQDHSGQTLSVRAPLLPYYRC